MKYYAKIMDHKSRVGTFSVEIEDAATGAEITALFDAVDGLALGAMAETFTTTRTDRDAGPGIPPANEFANRGLKWEVRYRDAVTLKIYQATIPAADHALLVPGSGVLDLTAGPGLAFKTAFESIALSPVGNAVALLSIEDGTRTD